MNFDPKKLDTLDVNLHGHRVGVINRLSGDQQLLSLDRDYIDDPARPTLSLSFKGRDNRLVVPTRPVKARLPAFFSNLLPEGHLRDYLAARAGVKSQREFFLLAVLGADLPGALTITAPDEATATDDDSELHAEENGTDGALRFSLAGVQLKFSAIMEASGGLTIPAQGMGGSWIVKLPSSRFAAVPENEYAMMTLARAAGIDVPTTKLVQVEQIRGLPDDAGALQGTALVVQRFDRAAEGGPIHIEDFAQVFGLYPHDKYDHRSYANIAAVLWAEAGELATYEFVRRLAFSVLIGNADMHLKNWSLLYRDRRVPELSPAYDFVATLTYIPNDKLALSFGGSRSLAEIAPDQIRRFAEAARLPVSPLWPIIAETTDRTVAAWEGLAEKELLPGEMRTSIEKQILGVAATVARINR